MRETMRLKVAITIAAIAVMLCACTCTLAGCVSENTTYVTPDVENTGRFECEIGYVNIIVDTRTGVQYLVWHEGSQGGVCRLDDKYGYPLLADGYSRVDVGMSDDEGE